MKIGVITDSLGALSFDELLGTVADLGIERLEFADGNWSQAPHLALDRMLDSAPARQEFLAKIADHALRPTAQQLGGNPIGAQNQDFSNARDARISPDIGPSARSR